MSDPVTIEIADAIATITLNNPAAHNSLGLDALTALRGALEAVAALEAVRVLVVTGAGDKTFCSGASLADLRSGKITGDDFQQVTDYLSAMAIPTIAALNRYFRTESACSACHDGALLSSIGY
jgi:enoyl-CoA hydratase/carnithine racemase